MFKLMLLFLVSGFHFFAMPSMAGAAPAGGSIYDAALGEWKDEAGKTFLLQDLKGKKVVVAMIYTSCQASCPLIVKKLKKVEEKLKAEFVAAEFVVITFDSRFDTPTKLGLFRKRENLLDSKWHVLVGNEKNTRVLANLLDIGFSINPKDQTISHEDKIVLLDEKGGVVRTLVGLSIDPKETLY